MGEFVDAANKLRDQLYQSAMKDVVRGVGIFQGKFVRVSDGRIGIVVSRFCPEDYGFPKYHCVMWFGEMEDGKPRLVGLLVQEDWELCPDFRDKK